MISEVCVVTESPMLAIELQEAVEDERICFEHVSSGERAITRAVCGCSTAILVDEDPSDMSPAGLLRQLSNSERGRDTLVILLSSRSTEIDRVIAFELGADDYVPKPIGARELSLRVSAVLRRHRDERLLNHKLEVGPLLIDTRRQLVTCAGEPLRLTSVEFRLLEHLARNLGEVQDRRVLLQRVWRWCDVSEERAAMSRTVDTHVKRLREKLGPAADFVETIRGVGYRLRPAAKAKRAG